MLNIKRIPLPLSQVIAALEPQFCLGFGAEEYRKRLLKQLRSNKHGEVAPIGFCGAMRFALPRHNRADEAASLRAFPKVLELIEKSGDKAPEFVTEVRKFTVQFQNSVRAMR